ncbi:MAG: hypothetical protein ACI8Y4_003296 [Candidatus Poriferisodalaceae bacterium]|jgi:hypothetical protein
MTDRARKTAIQCAIAIAAVVPLWIIAIGVPQTTTNFIRTIDASARTAEIAAEPLILPSDPGFSSTSSASSGDSEVLSQLAPSLENDVSEADDSEIDQSETPVTAGNASPVVTRRRRTTTDPAVTTTRAPETSAPSTTDAPDFASPPPTSTAATTTVPRIPVPGVTVPDITVPRVTLPPTPPVTTAPVTTAPPTTVSNTTPDAPRTTEQTPTLRSTRTDVVHLMLLPNARA